jgi:deazaflavin-dependent oxidoreductase (nitroreductase family)
MRLQTAAATQQTRSRTMAEQSVPPARPDDWRAQHLRQYLETDGEQGYLFNGVPTLILTTTGRRSGNTYQSPLIFGRDGDRYLIVGSRGGADEHPQWYRNLVANPEVGLQVKADRFRARARTATPEEKPALWSVMTGIWPAYNDYQTRTKREIPLVILERI